jgi:hypothetical protein
MLNVNTIEFNGQKAVINSFSDHPLLADDIKEQIAFFRAKFPNAIVKTERMHDAECIALVTAGNALVNNEPGRSAVWEIGLASKI